MSILNDNVPDLDEDTIYIGRNVYQPEGQQETPGRAVDSMPGFLNHWKHSDEFKEQLT